MQMKDPTRDLRYAGTCQFSLQCCFYVPIVYIYTYHGDNYCLFAFVLYTHELYRVFNKYGRIFITGISKFAE